MNLLPASKRLPILLKWFGVSVQLPQKQERHCHRIIEGEQLAGTSGDPVRFPLLVQMCLDQVAWERVQVSFETSREGDSLTSLGSLSQHSMTLEAEQFLFKFKQTLLCSSLCPLPLAHHWSPPHTLHPSDIYACIRLSLSSLLSRLKSLRSPSLSL